MRYKRQWMLILFLVICNKRKIQQCFYLEVSVGGHCSPLVYPPLRMVKRSTERFFLKPGFHAVCYIGTMPRFVQIETCFFGIIHCMLLNKLMSNCKRVQVQESIHTNILCSETQKHFYDIFLCAPYMKREAKWVKKLGFCGSKVGLSHTLFEYHACHVKGSNGGSRGLSKFCATILNRKIKFKQTIFVSTMTHRSPYFNK